MKQRWRVTATLTDPSDFNVDHPFHAADEYARANECPNGTVLNVIRVGAPKDRRRFKVRDGFRLEAMPALPTRKELQR